MPTFRPAWTSVLKVVTMFTLAHSITLWLAVMQYVTIPGSMVESAIAFSIIVSACLNLFRVSTLPSWTVAFGFGLIHGFGFANVLSDLGLRHLALASSLLGFNLGVEVGQLAIVLVVLPLLFLLRDSKLYHWGILRGGSVLVAVVAAVWMYERILNVEILPF
ncbi:MAG: HupE/UreJ family protein [Planctomycetales bacterium]|nr:HupE/UreJ family protein [Planctomycetales bacterium]